MKKFITLFALLAFLGGCSAHASFKPGAGGFCPPGQAKKGKC